MRAFCTACLIPICCGLAAGPPPAALLPAGALYRIGTPTERKDDSPISHVAFSPDGQTLVWPGWHATPRLYAVGTGKELQKFEGHRGQVTAVAFSPDGKLLATGGRFSEVRLWEVATGKEARQLDGHKSGVYAVAFSPDGKLLASGGGRNDEHKDYKLRIWETATGKLLHEIADHRGRLASLAFAPDGKTLAVGSWGWTDSISLWDPATGKSVRTIQARGSVWSLAFSPDGLTLVSGAYCGEQHLCCLWNVVTGEKIGDFGKANVEVQAVAFSPDGRTLAVGSRDHSLVLWELASGKLRRDFGEDPIGVASLAFAPDGKTLAVGKYDTTMVLFDLNGRTRPAGELAAGELETLWLDLAGQDGARAYQAIWALAAHPKQALALAKEQLRLATAAADVEQATKLIAELDAEDFATREAASLQLAKLGRPVLAQLRKALDGKPTPEARGRLDVLLERLDSKSDRLRFLRLVEVLEHIASPEAHAVLKQWSDAAPGDAEREQVKAALARLTRRGATP